MFQIDPTKTAEENLLGLINAGTLVTLSSEQYTISAPKTQVPADPEEDTNTTFTMTATQDSGYMDSVSPRYKRLSIGNTKPGALTTWPVTSLKTREELIADIIQAHQLVTSDVVFTGLETAMPAAGQTGTLTCTAIANSYLYIGSFGFTVENTDEEVIET
jgi:hypothetical protein